MSYTDSIPDKPIRLFNHILNAQQIWNGRITANITLSDTWAIRELKTLPSIDRSNYDITLRIIEEYDLNQMLPYTNTQGQTFNNTIRDILFQVINHSTYHRGQIAADFKQAGITPLATDYILFKRE